MKARSWRGTTLRGTAVLACGVAAALVVSAGRALGAETSSAVRLVYADRSGADCPRDSSLRASAVARLGYDPFSSSARATVTVTITRTARGLKGEISLEDPSRDGVASRTIESTSGDCVELGKAMALAISIAVDAMRLPAAAGHDVRPSEGARSSGTTKAPPSEPVGTGGAEDEHLVPPAEEPELLGDGSVASDIQRKPSDPALPSDDRAAHWQTSLHGLTSVGFTPGVTAGAVVGVGWVGYNRSIEIEGRADYPQSVTQDAGSISIWPLLFTVAPCVNVRGWVFCGLARAGALHGSGHRFAVNGAGWSPLATIGTRLGNEVILSRSLRFRVFFDLDWIATENSFDVDHRSAWATSTWAISLGLGLTTRVL